MGDLIELVYLPEVVHQLDQFNEITIIPLQIPPEQEKYQELLLDVHLLRVLAGMESDP